LITDDLTIISAGKWLSFTSTTIAQVKEAHGTRSIGWECPITYSTTNIIVHMMTCHPSSRKRNKVVVAVIVL
jgi:hypothetical protein